jgi:hypothetical protein
MEKFRRMNNSCDLDEVTDKILDDGNCEECHKCVCLLDSRQYKYTKNTCPPQKKLSTIYPHRPDHPGL